MEGEQMQKSTATTSLAVKNVPLDWSRTVDETDAADLLAAMTRQEAAYSCTDYLASDCSSACCPAEIPNNEVDEDCRVKMCSWCYQVIDYFNFNRETVAIAMSYLDRFLSTDLGRSRYLASRSAYQLAAITSLYIAIKVHEPMELDLTLLVELSRNCYTVAQVSAMESKILEGLRWLMNPPTPIAFVQHMLASDLLPSSVEASARQSMLDMARYHTELAVLDYSLVGQRPSHVAVSCLLNAMDQIEYSILSSSSRGWFLHNLSKLAGMSSITCSVVASRMNGLAFGMTSETSRGMGQRGVTISAEDKARLFSLKRRESSADLSPVCVSVPSSTAR